MAESLMTDSRVVFLNGEQKIFLLKIQKKTGLSWEILAKKVGVCRRTLTDWKRGKYSLPLKSLKIFLKISALRWPSHSEIRKPFWWTREAAKIAGKLVYQKYGTIGDPLKRRQRWLEWWQTKGRFNPGKYFVTKNIEFPKKSENLAEFVGTMIGDGAITPRQVTITVHYRDDRAYSLYVANLVYKLFSVRPTRKARKNRSVITIVISRTQLVRFCQSIGLVLGNKVRQRVDIPTWVMENRVFAIACMRGLMDTDGCIFNECHLIKGKRYCYPRLSFVSLSQPLRESVVKLLSKLDFLPKIRNNRSVQLEKRKDIVRYFKVVKSHNPKHLKRWRYIIGGVG